MADSARFLANDTVHHKPSGETWTLACDEVDGRVAPCGWPNSRADAKDCELIRRSGFGARVRTLESVSHCGDDSRASLARVQLAAIRKEFPNA